MEEWLGALKNATDTRPTADIGSAELLGGHHQWYPTNHARPTYCNVCRDALHGVTSHGLSCEVCKYKVHKRCSEKAINNCKWTTLASIGKDIIEDQDGNITMPHQWMEGNLPVASKCCICEKTCGSVLRLQDWRCLWCKVTVHTQCRPSISVGCPLGLAKLSVVPPTALHSIGSDEAWDATRPVGCSPLLVFVNSKSGDNQGIKFLRRFKQLLNPAQVFDLIKGGPGPGLRLFRHFDPFRILVCSGDGSVGWVLSEIDRLGMHKQCQVGVLPLGTGNDLARVLGWGASCDDDTNLPHLLEKYEKASVKMLDRWSLMIYERGISLPCHKILNQSDSAISQTMVHEYEDSALTHITNILHSDQETNVITSAKFLCQIIKEFAIRVSETSMNTGDHQLNEKGELIQQKLDILLHTLKKEESFLKDNDDDDTNAETLKPEEVTSNDQEKGSLDKPEKDMTNLRRVRKKRGFEENQAVMSRANSLKKAIRRLVEHTEQAIDEQNCGEKTTMDITITTESISEGKRRELGIPEVTETYVDTLNVSPIIESPANSIDPSPCSSPTPNLVSLSPMPDVRRDSQVGPDEFLTLPAPDGFVDSRRNSSNMQHGSFSFDSTTMDSVVERLNDQGINLNTANQASEPTQRDTQSDLPNTGATPSTIETSSPSDDTTIQDVMMSPDTDSVPSDDISPECPDTKSSNRQHKSVSCSNSLISSDSMVSDIPKNSESEIGYIDSDILDSTRRSELESPDIGHIDSPENSDQCMSENQNSDSIVDDLSSLGQDLYISLMGEKYDSVRETIECDKSERLGRRCTLAEFGEGSDIAKISYSYKNLINPKIRDSIKGRPQSQFGSIVERSSGEDDSNEASPTQDEGNKKSTDFLNAPMSTFKVTSSPNLSNEHSPKFPQHISVIVDPPSPSASIKSKQDNDFGFLGCDSSERRPSCASVEKLKVEYLDGVGCSPHASRRISSGSLLKASDLMSLAATASKFGSSMSLRHERSKSIDKTDIVKKLPIINPLVRLPMWPNVNGGFISKALLANADALCAAVSPLMDPDETLMEGYFERCVMNNYFGIGIDAKISLDFHHKREEHPEQCKSRTKNYLWYGVLGSKQMLQKTYKNLDQRVQLECDGQRIPLPSLQGIVVLNIPSFMGGTNFWGGTKEGDIFLAPSFDDRILEVVAVFGSVQMAASRLINLQHHRIAQCQTVQINILGTEGVPIQVDGEAWVQPPGIIRIIHKNRMQMLHRNRALETSLRAWEEKQRSTMNTVTQSSSNLSTSSRSQSQANIDAKQVTLTEAEMAVLLGFIEVVTTLVERVKLLIISHRSLEPDLYNIAKKTAVALERVHPNGKIEEGPNLRPVVTDLVSSARQLYEESCELLRDKAYSLKIREDLENKLSISLATMEQELRKCVFDERGTGLVYLQNIPEEQSDKKNRHRGLFWLKFRRASSNPTGSRGPCRDQVTLWGVQEVCSWLENLQLGEYAENFNSHDIRGRELLSLARRDLKELGITKVGHVKRILQAINDLNS
ncbi:hypothetical protein QAD02_019286 [Eretmocerus hayati]|uniref:Uncharacterized protein n=1 Tax=Eretmocerus hayati TaxID=131215 RepID=A0ACC2PLM3_9HYME|nr:hypothetical protein QAD02_019286 [Eretmocerus hayati]